MCWRMMVIQCPSFYDSAFEYFAEFQAAQSVHLFLISKLMVVEVVSIAVYDCLIEFPSMRK